MYFSVRVETSANVTNELQNQRRISLNQLDLRQKQRYTLLKLTLK